MSQNRLSRAKQLIQERRFDEAREILEQIPDDPTAQKWLLQLDRIAPQTTPKKRNLETKRQFSSITLFVAIAITLIVGLGIGFLIGRNSSPSQSRMNDEQVLERARAEFIDFCVEEGRTEEIFTNNPENDQETCTERFDTIVTDDTDVQGIVTCQRAFPIVESIEDFAFCFDVILLRNSVNNQERFPSDLQLTATAITIENSTAVFHIQQTETAIASE